MKVSSYCQTKLGVLLAVIFIVYVGVLGFSAIVAPIDKPGLLAGITFADSFTDDSDIAYLQDGLELLYKDLPEWYAYVDQAKPFTMSVDPDVGERGIAANTKCCDPRGNPLIVFGDHLGRLTASNDPSDQTSQAKQIAFLSTLVHEATHLYDYRAGRIPSKMDATTCIASEGAAYTKEFEFKRAAASATFKDARTGELYRRAAEKQLAADEEVFNGKFWKLYCILAHPNIIDD